MGLGLRPSWESALRASSDSRPSALVGIYGRHELISALIWVVTVGLGAVVLYRLKTRRSHSDRQPRHRLRTHSRRQAQAIEVVVSDKAAAHDFEHADDKTKIEQVLRAELQ